MTPKHRDSLLALLKCKTLAQLCKIRADAVRALELIEKELVSREEKD